MSPAASADSRGKQRKGPRNPGALSPFAGSGPEPRHGRLLGTRSALVVHVGDDRGHVPGQSLRNGVDGRGRHTALTRDVWTFVDLRGHGPNTVFLCQWGCTTCATSSRWPKKEMSPARPTGSESLSHP